MIPTKVLLLMHAALRRQVRTRNMIAMHKLHPVVNNQVQSGLELTICFQYRRSQKLNCNGLVKGHG